MADEDVERPRAAELLTPILPVLVMLVVSRHGHLFGAAGGGAAAWDLHGQRDELAG